VADLSPEALARAEQTIKAAPVFAANAELIASRTPALPVEHTLVAVVSADHEFTGTHVVSRAALVETRYATGPPRWRRSRRSGSP
jgi:hypothetical protein